jgi:hypothetical protein
MDCVIKTVPTGRWGREIKKCRNILFLPKKIDRFILTNLLLNLVQDTE